MPIAQRNISWMIAAAVLALLALPAASLAADEPTGATAGVAAAAAPTEAVASAAKPKFKLSTGGTYPYRGRRYVLPRAQITINGSVAADLNDQIVKVVIKKIKKEDRSKELPQNE